MKTTIITLITLFVVYPAFSQKKNDNSKPKPKSEINKEMFVGINLGMSLVGVLSNGAVESNDSILGFYKYYGKTTPVIGITADAFISKKISVGVNFTFQNIKMDIDSWQYAISDYIHRTNFNNKAKLTRMYLGGRFLYHYVNNSRADIYSGLRLGIIKWNMKLDNSIPELREQMFTDMIYFNRPAAALIPFGVRLRFKEKFAFCSEVTFGAPNFISAGLTYKISEKKKN